MSEWTASEKQRWDSNSGSLGRKAVVLEGAHPAPLEFIGDRWCLHRVGFLGV